MTQSWRIFDATYLKKRFTKLAGSVWLNDQTRKKYAINILSPYKPMLTQIKIYNLLPLTFVPNYDIIIKGPDGDTNND